MGKLGQGVNFFLTANGAWRDVERSLTYLAYEMDTFGVIGGAEFEAGEAVFGAALNYLQGETEIGASGEAATGGLQAALYGGWSGAGAFVQGKPVMAG